MRNNHGPEVPAALPLWTIVIKSRLSCVFFSYFLTLAMPTTQRIPVLPSTPVSSKLIWKWGCSLRYSSVGWVNLRWCSQTVSIVECQKNCCSILMYNHAWLLLAAPFKHDRYSLALKFSLTDKIVIVIYLHTALMCLWSYASSDKLPPCKSFLSALHHGVLPFVWWKLSLTQTSDSYSSDSYLCSHEVLWPLHFPQSLVELGIHCLLVCWFVGA